MEVVTIFKKHGWTWGGDWRTFVDMPHFEKSFGYDWRGLLAIHNDGQLEGSYVKINSAFSNIA